MKTKLILFLALLALCGSGVRATVTQPTLTTDVNNPVYYTIKNYRSNKYAAFAGASTQLAQVASTTSATLWYFIKNGEGVSIVPADAPSLKLATNSSATADGAVWYLVENPYRSGYFCLSLQSDLSSKCWDDNSSHTGVGYWNPRSNDNEGTSWTIEQAKTIPTGYYYFKGMATDRYPYLYSDFVTKGENDTYHHNLPVSPSNGNIWKVINNGTTFNLTNGEGLPLIIGSTSYETLTIGSAAIGPDIYFTEAINLTNLGNDTKLTTWAGHADASDNHWTFERVDVSAGVYDVVIVGNPNGYVSYGNQNAKNGGFFVASSISAGNLTAAPVANYTPSIDVSGTTITVTYTADYTYTLTDENGAIYNWSASGSYGVSPTITGCYGYTLSNEVWDEAARTYTANIAFQFPVSSDDVDNYTYIGCHKYYGYQNKMYLYAKTSSATDIRVQKDVFPTNETGVNERYMWAIIPAFSNGAFTFTIKNASTGTYITSTSDKEGHTGTEVSLSNSGTPLEYKNNATYSGCWYIPSTDKYLSVNSYNTSAEQFLGTWNSAHSGTSMAYIEPADFSTLEVDLKTAYDAFNDFYDDYYPLISAGTYTEMTSGAMASAYSNNIAVNNVIKDDATNYFTASQFETYTNKYNNAVSGVRYVAPSFFRVRNLDGSKYVKAGWRDYANYIQLVLEADGNDASSIFYLTASNNILSYYSGSYLFAINHTCPVAYASSYKSTYEFLPGSAINKIYVHSATNPIGWGGDNRYWSIKDNKVDRVSTPTEDCDFIIEEVTSLPVTLSNIEGHGFASFYTPVGISSLPDGVKAYIASVDGDRIRFTNITDIPANTGVILYQPTYTEGAVNLTIGDASSSTTGNVLNGIVASTPLETVKTNLSATNILTMQNDRNKGLGFYQYTGTNLNGFKAFVKSDDTAGVKSFVFDFDDDDATGIVSLLEKTGEGTAIYNIAGQRLSKMQKGINIVNGKKILK